MSPASSRPLVKQRSPAAAGVNDILNTSRPLARFPRALPRFRRRALRAPGRLLVDDVLPRQRHHLADELFVRFRKDDACRPTSSPCAARGSKDLREITHECLLLLGRELDHALAGIS